MFNVRIFVSAEFDFTICIEINEKVKHADCQDKAIINKFFL